MKKIKTIEAVKAYNTLKELKTSSMSDETMMNVWKDMKALRPVAEEYDKSRKEANDSLQNSDEFKDMQSRLQAAQEKERKKNVGEYEQTQEDLDEIVKVNTYFTELNEKTRRYFAELDNKEEEVDIKTIGEADLLKAIKDSAKGFDAMERLEVVME